MFDTRKFGAFIARLRKNADMTQSELSDRLNLTRQAVSTYERGDSFPDISVLKLLAEVFNVSTGLLIAAGEPTEGEAEILDDILSGREIKPKRTEDVVNLAPYLKPSILSKLSESMSKNGIDMSSVVSLAEYLNESDSQKLLKAASFDNIAEMDVALLEKLLPLLGPFATEVIFDKILSGELDFHYLDSLSVDDYNISLVEQAVISGVLDDEVFYIMRRQAFNRGSLSDNAAPPKIFTCPKCGLTLSYLYPTRCKCGFKVPASGYTLRFTEQSEPSRAPLPAVDVNWLTGKFGDGIIVFVPGVGHTNWASRLASERRVWVIVADGDAAQLKDADTATKNRNEGQLLFMATDLRSPYIADGAVDVAIASPHVPDSELRRILKPGGCVVGDNRVLWEKGADN